MYSALEDSSTFRTSTITCCLPPTITCCLPRLPAAFHDYLLPPTIDRVWPESDNAAENAEVEIGCSESPGLLDVPMLYWGDTKQPAGYQAVERDCDNGCWAPFCWA
jgi:hypothetical protein